MKVKSTITKSEKSRQLMAIRYLGVAMLLFAVFIAWYDVSGNYPRKFWRDISLWLSGSVYDSDGKWMDHHGNTLSLSGFRGKVSVISFIYLYCQDSCPPIVAELKKIANSTAHFASNTQFLIFLLDDVSRKPEEMNKVFTAFQIKDNNRWKVLSADTDTVSRLADKLDLRYTVLDRKTFSYFHSNAIAIVGYDGSIVQVYYGLNFRTDDMLKTISRQVNEAARTTISP